MLRRLAARPGALPRDPSTVRGLADQALSRTAGAPQTSGNSVRVLRDAAENYPTWARAIIDARETIHIEMYIIHRDQVGRRFVELLATRARAGVKVRLVYDWWGCGLGPLFGLFRPLIQAGGEVRAFNPPSIGSILGWVRRNHRKVITVDGRVTFISGLCLGQMWEGRPDRHQAPWRDTGIEVIGPAVAHAEAAFAESWRLAGGEIDPVTLPKVGRIPASGDVSLRIIPTEPFTASMLQLDLLVAAMARRKLWITDAYFAGHGPYIEALRRAAGDGVDVRLLLPQGSDLGWTVPFSRTLYRTLIESGIRVFEWKGPMLHAKTAVADDLWARVGSTNLNLLSWIGNWEMDVAIEDATIAGRLADHFRQDLTNATEVVLDKPRPRPPAPPRVRARRSARKAVRTVGGVGPSITAAVTGNRPLEDYEVAPLVGTGLVLSGIAGAAIWRPAIVAWPIAVLLGWTGISFVVEAAVRWWRRRPRETT
jgi:phosphatidylserine/phosphatidylglycerophosphate/cardiolipin synthase-like enzyme